MKKIFGLISLFTIFLLVLSACSSGPSGTLIELRVAGNARNIAGGAFNINQGSQLQFEATLVQNGLAISEAQIEWDLVSNTRDSVQRSGASPFAPPVVESDAVDGLVRIAPNQPDGLLRLNVTTTHEGNLVGAYVIINASALPLVIPNTAHKTFQDPETGTWWRVLLPNDGNGNALIITEYVHVLNTRYHRTAGFTLLQSAEVSNNLRRWWNNEWMNNGITASPHEQNVIGTQLRKMALNYEFQDESGGSIPRMNTTPGTGIEVNRGHGTENSPAGAVHWDTDVLRGHTRPVPNSNFAAEPFILSTSEVSHYFNASTGSQGRQTQQFNATSTDANWWLRSPGNSADASNHGRHAIINSSGNFSTGNATDAWGSGGLRPALWIRR